MATKHQIKQIKKRDGSIVPFDQSRITNAIFKAMQATGEANLERDPIRVSEKVINELSKKKFKESIPAVEEIQDIVEEALILMDFPKTVKAYILYRQNRAEIRKKKHEVPDHVKKLVAESKKYFSNSLSEFIYYRTYARWIDAEQRRETWIETVDRYVDYMRKNIGKALKNEEYQLLRQAILEQRVMPSMRLMWAAGAPADKSHATAYNCSFIAPSELKDFSEIIYLLMCGTGVGFSVESHNVQKLPQVKMQKKGRVDMHVIGDSREGWADALYVGMKHWFYGKDIMFDYSQLRPAGAKLKTMGGKSSGPEPLRALLDFTRDKILARQGKRLKNIDVHDIICKIGELVVMGGVRRSALISLSDLDDEEIRAAKAGQFYLTQPQRMMANNSAVYNEKPGATQFLDEWLSLAKSGSGERGIFNRGGLEKQLPHRRWRKFTKHLNSCGTNPCGEIVLRSKQFCNLTEVVARPDDTLETLLQKVRLATILGTYQSTLTNFPYLSKEWKKNCDEERLLGVSLTGQWDCPQARDVKTLKKMLAMAIRTNKIYAKKFGISESTCITTVKPSGTVSQLVNSSSGMHPRHSQYYIRRVRISASDVLFQMLKDQKFPYYPEVGQLEQSANTYVIEFPVKSPGKIFKNDLSAIEQLEHWKKVKTNYTEHNPSVTISVGPDEWISTANWIYSNWDILGGLSFLPREDHVYRLAPYEEISEDKYNQMVAKLPKIDFSQIIIYEKEDETVGAKELACVSGVCEVDATSAKTSKL